MWFWGVCVCFCVWVICREEAADRRRMNPPPNTTYDHSRSIWNLQNVFIYSFIFIDYTPRLFSWCHLCHSHLMWFFPITQVLLEEGKKEAKCQFWRNILSPKALPSLIMRLWCICETRIIFVLAQNNQPSFSLSNTMSQNTNFSV